MKLVYSLRRKPFLLGILMVLLIGFAVTGIWSSRATREKGTAGVTEEMTRTFHAQIKEGVGAEVQFARSGSSPAQISESVDSVARFIQERSGLPMGNATKTNLIGMEQSALESGRRISTTELSIALAETITERMATVSDGEIARAEKSFNPSGEDSYMLRADGRYRLPKDRLMAEAQTLRTQALAGDGAVGAAVRVIVEDAIEERVSLLSAAVTDKFGNASNEGLTPVQALVITYSVLTDDNLAHSSNTLKQMAQQATDRPLKKGKTDLAYGPEGRLFSTPVQLFFNQEVMGRFLGRLQKGGN
jgi:hypothetical protein